MTAPLDDEFHNHLLKERSPHLHPKFRFLSCAYLLLLEKQRTAQLIGLLGSLDGDKGGGIGRAGVTSRAVARESAWEEGDLDGQG